MFSSRRLRTRLRRTTRQSEHRRIFLPGRLIGQGESFARRKLDVATCYMALCGLRTGSNFVRGANGWPCRGRTFPARSCGENWEVREPFNSCAEEAQSSEQIQKITRPA